jgi:hypothetical protein
MGLKKVFFNVNWSSLIIHPHFIYFIYFYLFLFIFIFFVFHTLWEHYGKLLYEMIFLGIQSYASTQKPILVNSTPNL